MATITTLTAMRAYILRQLGYPVVNVEISTDQLNDIIEDTVQIMNRYLYGEAGYQDYIQFSVTSGTDEYSLSGNDILDVYDFEFSTGTNGINTIFSPVHSLLYHDWVVLGNYPGGGQGLNLTSYQISMAALKDVNRYFGRDYMVDWRPAQEVLKLTPTPNEDLDGIILVYKKSLAEKLYNHEFTKKLAVAKARQIWGMLLGKFVMTLPGGGTINGESQVSKGERDEEDVMQRIELEGEPLGIFMG